MNIRHVVQTINVNCTNDLHSQEMFFVNVLFMNVNKTVKHLCTYLMH